MSITETEVAAELVAISECAGDYEAAHDMEDRLRARVLETIASGLLDVRACAKLARLALKSESIDFPRHYA